MAPAIGWLVAVFAMPNESSALVYVGLFLALPAALAILAALLRRADAWSLVFGFLAALVGGIGWLVTAFWGAASVS
jgi:hypothetical protein